MPDGLKCFRSRILVTVNDSSNIGLPSGGSIFKNLEISSATLRFPNKHGRLLESLCSRDVFRIYLGIDDISPEPIFTGFPIEISGRDEITISLMGRLSALEKEYVFIDDFFNYDGEEAVKVIQRQIEESSVFGSISVPIGGLQGSNPMIFVPSSFRHPKGISRYQVIKAMKDLLYDISMETGEVLRYVMFEHGDGKYIVLKQKPLTASNVELTLRYGYDAITTDPNIRATDIVNKQTVFSKDGDKVTFSLYNDIRKEIFGVHEGSPISLDSGSNEDAFRRAMVECLTKRRPTVTTNINSIKLLDAVPGITIINLINAPSILNGIQRIMSVNVDFSDGITVSCELENIPPIFSKSIAKLIASSRYSAIEIPTM